jgi:acyl-CoA reductase-like NAD-dependent aldehyde dehydrogenase
MVHPRYWGLEDHVDLALVGVVGAIIPWNGPMGLIAAKTAPALLAGCTVVLKASPEAPGEAYVMAEIAEAVGLPSGVLNVVGNRRRSCSTISTSPPRRRRSWDVVTRNRHDDLVEALSESFSRVQVGDPFDAQTQMGPLAMHRQRDRVEGYIAKGVEEGATLAAGGGRPRDLPRGFFIEPTVFGNVDNSSTIAREEIFGQVLSVIAADDEQDAIEIANDTIYGLNASVFTNDDDRAFDVARQLRAGTVGHNSFRTDFGIAFGGPKQSGIGREGGREGLLPYLETKTIIL